MDNLFVSVVIIGRNEGNRLVNCIKAVQNLTYPKEKMEIIYVDSRSSDDSLEQVRKLGVKKVFVLEEEKTCAAMGRNKGLEHAEGELVLFLDGDTQIWPDFLETAIPHFVNPEIGIVYGRRVEIHPESLYIRLCGSDWSQRTPGYTETSAGDVLIRKEAIQKIGGYKEIIAGEDPEMSNRIINAGYKILFLDKDMVKHDLAMHSFKQYWKHSVRSGFAYAVIASMTKDRLHPLYVEKNRKIMIQGLIYSFTLIGSIIVSLIFKNPLAILVYLFFGTLIVGRSFIKNRNKGIDPAFNLIYSVHSHFLKIPLLIGQITYVINKNKTIIEYK
jgi:cellulose synthase/poly-beta-1,6-N-acetylglucosamine synthase-like glycosyltransferase